MEYRGSRNPWMLLPLVFVALIALPAAAARLQEPAVYVPLIQNEYPRFTPTPIPPDILVLSEERYLYGGALHLVGEVRNQSGEHLEDIVLKATLYNSSNQVLASTNEALYLYHLEDGEKTCYHITFLSPPANWSYSRIEALSYSSSDGAIDGLVVISLTGDYDRNTGNYTLSGEIRNGSEGTVRCVKAVGTLYDRDGDVLGCSYEYVTGYNLLRTVKSAYEILYFDRDYADVTNYRVQPDGLVQ